MRSTTLELRTVVRAFAFVAAFTAIASTSRAQVVINEVRFQPADASVRKGENPASLDFVELYNAGSASVDLSGWSLTQAFAFRFPQGTSLSAGGFLVVATNPTALDLRGPAIPYGVNVLIWDGGTLAGSGPLRLVNGSGTAPVVVDELAYDPAGLRPVSPDGTGPSLELVNPNVDDSSLRTWRASTSANGSPGAVNTVFTQSHFFLDAPSIISMPDDATGGQGSPTVVSISATPADGISGIDITLEYDPSVLVATSVTTTPLSAGFALSPNTTTPGIVYASMFRADPIAGPVSGPILDVHFDVVGAPSDSTPLDLTFAEINEGEIPTILDDGLFVVSCAGASNGTPCDDGSLCTFDDVCTGGVCGGTSVSCTSLDNACNVGVCNPTSGLCESQARPNGTFCGDAGTACVNQDTCSNGVCQDNGFKPNGTACSDGDACTQTDTCQAGACTGANPVVCAASDQCHNAGTCSPGTGLCSNPPKVNGTPCTDANACTTTDTCQAGSCASGPALQCSDGNGCNGIETCSPASGCVAGTPPSVDVSLSIPDDAAGSVGSHVIVPVIATPAHGSGVDLRIEFDPAVLSFVTATRTTLTQTFNLTFNQPTPGVLLISLFRTTPMSGSGAIVNVEFAVVGSGGSVIPLALTRGVIDEGDVSTCLDSGEFTACASCDDGNACTTDVCTESGCVHPALDCNDGNGCNGVETCNPGSGCVAGTPPSVSVALSLPDDAAGVTGSHVLVPVVATPAMGAAVDLRVTFNPSVIQATNVTLTTITAGFNLTFNLSTPGVALISLFRATPMSGTGPIVYIDFLVVGSDGTTSALTLTQGTIEEGDISTCLDGGTLSVCGSCDDGDGCTVDTCTAQVGCVHTPLDCNDGSSCTTDSCNAGSCVHTSNGSCSISGTVYYYRDSIGSSEPSTKPVPGVDIDTNLDSLSNDTTDAAGAYSVTGLSGNVTVSTLSKYDSVRAADNNGAITSFDASTIAQFAVHAISLSANQLIAGDVTGNTQVTSFDASFVAQFATHIIDHFPVAGTSSDWRFLRCDVYGDGASCTGPSFTHSPLTQSETDNFYAILYGDVTGNWQPAALLSSASPSTGSGPGDRPTVPEEQAAALQDAVRTERLADAREAAGRRRQGNGPAKLSLSGWTKPLNAHERRTITVSLEDADGILGLDMKLGFDPSQLTIVGVQGTGIGSGFSFVGNDLGGDYRIAGYGPLPLAGSGSLLTITVEAQERIGSAVPIRLRAEANEGRISLVVVGRAHAPVKAPLARPRGTK